MTKKRLLIILLGLLFISGLAGGYIFFSKISTKETPSSEKVDTLPKIEDLIFLKIYYPVDNGLQIEEKGVQLRTTQKAIAQAVIEEFLKGPTISQSSVIPKNAKLLGIYKDTEKILYVDLSEEFRRNLQCDALSEYLVLKGLYDSLKSNLDDLEDIKILIEGREIETLGGHFFLSFPLKNIASYESNKSQGYREDNKKIIGKNE
ncbi:MAG: GerMN domain-containing protein [Thermodesulfovibrionales bacterium]